MDIIVYTISNCADCGFVVRLLQQRKLPFTEINVDSEEARAQFNAKYPNIQLVPLVEVDGMPLKRFTDIALLKAKP